MIYVKGHRFSQRRPRNIRRPVTSSKIHKVAGSVPDGVIGHFLLTLSFWPHYGPRVDSASNRNEYQESSLGIKAACA
jgi:hypothetical protein